MLNKTRVRHCWLTVVYAHNQINKRRELWNHIKRLSNTINELCMVIGDYNNVLTMEDKIGGCPVQEVEYYDLEDMMKVVGLFEYTTHGNHHTWSNKHTNWIIYSRIGKDICDKNWFLKFPNSEIEILAPDIFDHAPLKVAMDPNIPSKKKT